MFFLSLLFNALYLYIHSADESFLDVLPFSILAGPDVCVHLMPHLIPECDLIHLIWP